MTAIKVVSTVKCSENNKWGVPRRSIHCDEPCSLHFTSIFGARVLDNPTFKLFCVRTHPSTHIEGIKCLD